MNGRTNERTSDEIRRDIERKRTEMDHTVDELERRLTPAQMLDHALWFLRDSDSGSERVRSVRNGVTRFAKDHPMPVALMSAGAAWLAAESARDDVGPGTYAPAEGRVGPYMGDAIDEGSLREDGGPSMAHRARERVSEKMGDATDAVRERAHDAADSARDRISSARDDASERISSVREGASERMHAAGDRVRERADAARDRGADLARRTREQAHLRGRQARERYDRTLDENPLVLGAAAFGLGLTAGLSAPSTQVERETMGAKSDVLKDEARSLARDTGHAAKAAGRDALDVARREALPEGIVDEVKGRVERVASNAMTAARETARREGIDGDTLKDRAKRIASDAAHAAKDTARSEGLNRDALKERAVEAREHTREA